MQYNSGDYEYFYSEEYSNTAKTPVFTFGYIEPAGVKNYWTYNSQNVEEAGTGLVSDFTGNMYFNRTDLEFATEKQSFGLSMIYSVNRYSSDIGYGDGWRTNYNMLLDYDSDLDLWFTEDASGNIVYYHDHVCDDRIADNYLPYYYRTCKIAEDGSKNLLVAEDQYQSPRTYKILTTDQIEYDFGTDEYLDQITNTKFNIDIFITRNSTYKDRIEKITDESGNEIVLEYSGGTRVDYAELRIKNSSGYHVLEKVDYTYDTGGRLTQIEYLSNYNNISLKTTHIATYDYDGSYRLDEITSNSGAHIKYTYNSSKKVTRIDSSKIDGAKTYDYGYVTYQYDVKRTTITDQNGEFINYYFDNFGHTITVLDCDGVSQHFRYMNPLVYNIGTEFQPDYMYFKDAPLNYYWNHQKISESQPQITVQNPISNHSFEYDINNDATWYNEIDDMAGSTMSPTYYETTSRSVFGDKSAYVYNPVTGQESHMEQQIILDPDTYTISGYVYGSNSTEGWIEVYVNGVRHQTTPITTTGEWQYLEKTFTVSSSGCVDSENCEVEVRLYNSNYGYMYFDNIQLVTGFRDARKNLVDNASFENSDPSTTPTGWYFSDQNVVLNENRLSLNEYEYVLGDNVLQIWNPGNTLKYASYGLYDLNYNSNEEYNIVIGSFASAYYTSATTVSTADQHTKLFRIRVDFMSQTATATNPNYSTYLIDSAYINFDATADGLQYVMEEVSVPLGTEFINIRYEYEAMGIVYFDNLQVYERPVFTNYYYDEDTGFRTDTVKPSGEMISAQYTEMDNTPTNVQVKNPDGTISADVNTELTTSYYASSVIVNNVKSTPSYNSDGQVTSITIGEGSTFTTYTYYSSFENQYISSTKDEHLKYTYYYYDDLTGLLDQVKDANSNDTQYEYYSDGKLYKVRNIDYCQSGSCAEVSYVYDEDLLTKIILTTGYGPDNNYYGYYYELTYDDLDRIESVKVVNDNETSITGDDFVQELMSYTYNMDGTYYTSQIGTQDYGNGDSLKFEYNDMDQIETILFKEYGTSTYKKKFGYEYDHRNRVAAMIIYDDNQNVERTEYYTYDESNNLIQISDNEGNEIKYGYDEQGNLISLDFKVGSNTISTDYFYNELFYFDRDMLHENNSLNLDIIQATGEIREEISTTITHNSNESITVQTTAGSKDPSFGGVIAVQPSSSYTLSMDITSLTGEVRYNIFQFCGNPYNQDNYLGESLMFKSTSSSSTGTRTYQFTTSANTRYIIISLFDDSAYTITFDDMVLDYDNKEMSNLYDKTVYTTIAGNNVVKDYNYEQSALYRLNNIKTTIGSTLFEQNINFSGNTTRIASISYDFDNNDSVTTETYKYLYSYDNLGNITYIYYLENGSYKMKYHYEYDSLNQLIQEDVYEYGNCSVYSETSCYTKYFKYDLRGNITDVKWYDYGEEETSNPVIPSFRQVNYGSYDATMNYNGGNDYQDIYNLNVGQSPNLSFTYTDEMWQSQIMGMNTTMTYNNLNTSVPGYYYRTYRATDNNWYDLEFRIVFKVGNPVAGPNTPEKHIRYTYSTDWLDQLVSYGEVQYDASGDETGVTTLKSYSYNTNDKDQGNPLSITNFEFDGTIYHHADLEYSGRQLTNIKIYNASNVLQHEIIYTYNDQGYRTSKTIDSTTIEYTLSGDKVLFESDGTYGIIYTYDADGKIISFSYDDNINNGNSYTDYFYVRNQQGDITKIVDKDLNVIVEYRYDAWGNILSTKEYNTDGTLKSTLDIALVNQYTYRGYRYDQEIDLYYLNSRFYDSNVGRFLNADGLLGPQGSISGHNIYSYTQNNPVMNIDPSGNFIVGVMIASIVVSLVFEGLEDYFEDGEMNHTLGQYAGAFVSGFFAGLSGGVGALIGYAMLGGTLDYFIAGDFNSETFVSDMLLIGATSLISVGLGHYAKKGLSALKANKILALGSNNLSNRALKAMGLGFVKVGHKGVKQTLGKIISNSGKYLFGEVSQTVISKVSGDTMTKYGLLIFD